MPCNVAMPYQYQPEDICQFVEKLMKTPPLPSSYGEDCGSGLTRWPRRVWHAGQVEVVAVTEFRYAPQHAACMAAAGHSILLRPLI